MARLADGAVTFYNLDGDEISRELTEIEWDAEAAEKGGFEHFMMKEIHEQPKAVADTLSSVIRDGRLDLSGVGQQRRRFRAFPRFILWPADLLIMWGL